VIDGSTRTSHSNAFVTGFFFVRKVVIFDTLIESFTNSEILGVVCHELGHVAHNHIVWNMVSSSLQITVMFSVFTLCLGNQHMLSAFELTHASNFMYLFVFQMLYSPTGFFV
jgi:STE24 endopeptidase